MEIVINEYCKEILRGCTVALKAVATHCGKIVNPCIEIVDTPVSIPGLRGVTEDQPVNSPSVEVADDSPDF